MSGCVARRAAVIGSLILLVAAPAEAHHPGGGGNTGGNTGSVGPIDTISAEGRIAAAIRYEFIQLGQLDDTAPLASAEQGRHSIRSIENVSLSAAYGITINFMVAVRTPHVRHSDISEAAEQHRGQPRPNDDVAVGDSRPANGSRTALTRSLA